MSWSFVAEASVCCLSWNYKSSFSTVPPPQEQDVELQQNQAYVKTPDIPVKTNECYGTTTSATTSVSADQLYATPTEGRDQHSTAQQLPKEDYDYIIP